MALVTAAQVSEQLERWQRGEGSAAELAQWARATRSETDSVNSVLARMQVLDRGSVSSVDIQVLRNALRSPEAASMLDAHFGAAGAAAKTSPPPKPRAPRLRARARLWRFYLRAHHILFGAAGAGAGIGLAGWLYWRYGLDFDAEGLVGLAGLAAVTAVAVARVLVAIAKIVVKPCCPFCGANWDLAYANHEHFLFMERRCPGCRARF